MGAKAVDPLCVGGVGFGPRHHVHPPRVMGAGVPYLPAVDLEEVALIDGAGLQRGQGGTGAGFRVALAPGLAPPEHRSQEAALLRLRPPPHQGRSPLIDVRKVRQGRRRRAPVLLIINDLLDQPRAASAVFGRPPNSDPARLEHLFLKGAALLEYLDRLGYEIPVSIESAHLGGKGGFPPATKTPS